MLCPSMEDGVSIKMDIAEIGSLMKTSGSLSILLSHTTSHAATVTPLYSASVLEREIVSFFLLLPDIALLSREKTNPEVDRLLAL